MKNSVKYIAVTVCFCVFLGFFLGMSAYRFFNPVDISLSERRPLALFPKNITLESIIDKSFMTEYEAYSADQFPFREFFRTLKAHVQLNILQLKENNSIAVKNGYFVKTEKEFSDALCTYSLGRLDYVYNKYLKDSKGNKYLCLIPDKNYFFKSEFNYPAPDYEQLKDKAVKALPDFQYIDIFDTLKLSDFYYTDTHWRQERLCAVTEKVAAEMGIEDNISWNYKENVLEGFAGVYYGQSGLRPEKDTLIYLSNETLDSCTVFDYETNETINIYAPELISGKDGYDVFLYGAKALLRIDNPGNTEGKELVIFRDSFASSFAPLLTQAYSSIYLVDIRYISPDVLGNFIDFDGKDILYLYSSLVINQKAFK